MTHAFRDFDRCEVSAIPVAWSGLDREHRLCKVRPFLALHSTSDIRFLALRLVFALTLWLFLDSSRAACLTASALFPSSSVVVRLGCFSLALL